MIDAAKMNDAWGHVPGTVKGVIDLAAITAWLGALLSLLPHISTILTVIWMAIRIYESDTVQRVLGRIGDTAGKEKSHHEQID